MGANAYTNYKKIELIGFDPYNENSFYDKPHATTKLVNETNVYEFLNFCKKNKLLKFDKNEKCFF